MVDHTSSGISCIVLIFSLGGKKKSQTRYPFSGEGGIRPLWAPLYFSAKGLTPSCRRQQRDKGLDTCKVQVRHAGANEYRYTLSGESRTMAKFRTSSAGAASWRSFSASPTCGSPQAVPKSASPALASACKRSKSSSRPASRSLRCTALRASAPSACCKRTTKLPRTRQATRPATPATRRPPTFRSAATRPTRPIDHILRFSLASKFTLPHRWSREHLSPSAFTVPALPRRAKCPVRPMCTQGSREYGKPRSAFYFTCRRR